MTKVKAGTFSALNVSLRTLGRFWSYHLLHAGKSHPGPFGATSTEVDAEKLSKMGRKHVELCRRNLEEVPECAWNQKLGICEPS